MVFLMNAIVKTETYQFQKKYIQATICIIKLFHTFAHVNFVHIQAGLLSKAVTEDIAAITGNPAFTKAFISEQFE